MNLNIRSSHNLDITEAIAAYVQEKLNRITRHYDHIISTNVILCMEQALHTHSAHLDNHHTHSHYTAEVTVRVSGKDIHCKAQDDNLYAAIDLLADKLDRQILKHKARIQDHAAIPVKHQPVVDIPVVA